MTVSSVAQVSTSVIGFDPAVQFDVPQFNLGMRVKYNTGDEYMFVRYTTAKTAGTAYLISTAFTVGAAVTSTALASLPSWIGVPVSTTSAAATGYTYKFGWIQVAGTIAVDHCDTAITPAGGLVYTTANAGILDDTAASNKALPASWTATFASGVAASIFAQTPLYYSGT